MQLWIPISVITQEEVETTRRKRRTKEGEDHSHDLDAHGEGAVLQDDLAGLSAELKRGGQPEQVVRHHHTVGRCNKREKKREEKERE